VNTSKITSILLLPGAHTSPSGRVRVLQFVSHFKKMGFQVRVAVPFPDREFQFPGPAWNFLNRLPRIVLTGVRMLSALFIAFRATKYEYVIMNRDLLPDLRFWMADRLLLKWSNKIVFDFDDAIYLGPRRNKVQFILERVDAVVCGNKIISEFARLHNLNVTVIPSVVDTKLFVPTEKKNSFTPIIGWIGSSYTRKAHLPMLQEPLELLAKRCDFEFRVIADENPMLPWTNVNIKFVKWTEENEIHELQQLSMGLMPLSDSEFEKGKCGFKAIQYMSVGVPALVSPVGVNAEIVEHGSNGFHCRSVKDWVDSMYYLINNNDKALLMGAKARDKIVNEYSMDKALTLWSKVLNSEQSSHKLKNCVV
jgi:glycosyltransferase involved in cell wall biosynthesis